jgi:hypothetical protein
MKKIILLLACFFFITNTISAQCTLKVAIDTIIHVSCYAGADGAIYVKTMNAQLPVNYNWGFVNNRPNIVNLKAGKYNVTVTDNLGCRDSILNIKVNQDTPIITVTTTPATNGVNGKATVTLVKGTSTFTRNFFNLVIGVNDVVFVDPQGCYYAIEIVITGTTAQNDLNNEGLEKFEINQISSNNANVLIQFNEEKNVELNVFTITGQKVHNQSLRIKDATLNIMDLPSGLLLFTLKIKDKIAVKKAILIK